MIYADILSFLKPEFLRGVLTGSVEGTRITQGILVASAVLLESSEVGVPLPGRGDVLVQVGAAPRFAAW